MRQTGLEDIEIRIKMMQLNGKVKLIIDFVLLGSKTSKTGEYSR